MGFKIKSIFKAVTKALDPLRPEWEKKLTGKIEKAVGIRPGSMLSTLEAPESSSAPAATGPSADELAAIENQKRMDDIEQNKRMARMGKYFTSPTGVLGGGGASQKVFS